MRSFLFEREPEEKEKKKGGERGRQKRLRRWSSLNRLFPREREKRGRGRGGEKEGCRSGLSFCICFAAGPAAPGGEGRGGKEGGGGKKGVMKWPSDFLLSFKEEKKKEMPNYRLTSLGEGKKSFFTRFPPAGHRQERGKKVKRGLYNLKGPLLSHY